MYSTCIQLSKKLPIHWKLIEVARIAIRLENTCQSFSIRSASDPMQRLPHLPNPESPSGRGKGERKKGERLRSCLKRA